MKIDELTDKKSDVNVRVKVIYDRMKEKDFKGKTAKTLVVVDEDEEKGSTSALLDLFGREDIDRFKFIDKIDVVNCYAKKIKTDRGEQICITPGYDSKSVELIGHYEAVKE